jgi:hypothetical protein
MTAVVLALGLGGAAFPLVLVFGPVYFPWTLLVLACLGGITGLSIVASDPRSRVLISVGAAVLMVAAVLAVGTFTANFALNPRMLVALVVWSTWLLPPILSGALVGARLRARFGIVRGAVTGAAASLVIAGAGAILAFAAAPPEIATAPACDGDFECPRTQCAYMAERRRVLAIERVTAFDGERITCTYTAWGGIYIGRAEMGRGGGSWTDGMWPMILSGRVR